jgi:hypothetical protein
MPRTNNTGAFMYRSQHNLGKWQYHGTDDLFEVVDRCAAQGVYLIWNGENEPAAVVTRNGKAFSLVMFENDGLTVGYNDGAMVSDTVRI